MLTRSGFLHWLQNAGQLLPCLAARTLTRLKPCENMQAAMGSVGVQCMDAVKEQVKEQVLS